MTFEEMKSESLDLPKQKFVETFDKKAFQKKLKEMHSNLVELEKMFSGSRACYEGISSKSVAMMEDIHERMGDMYLDAVSGKE